MRESIAQYRIYDKHETIWTIKGEDLHLSEDCHREDWEIKWPNKGGVSSFEKSSLDRQKQSILKYTEEMRGKKKWRKPFLSAIPPRRVWDACHGFYVTAPTLDLQLNILNGIINKASYETMKQLLLPESEFYLPNFQSCSRIKWRKILNIQALKTILLKYSSSSNSGRMYFIKKRK